MKKLLNRFKTKPTIFLIGGVSTILYSIPAIFYFIPRTGGESMYALLYFYLIGIACIALIVDVGLTAIVNFKIVSFVECAIIGGIYLTIAYNNKTATIDITAIKKPYIVIVDDQNGVGLNRFQRSGLFNKEYKIKDTDIIRIDKSSLKHYELVFTEPKSWEESGADFNFRKPRYRFDCDFMLSRDLSEKYSEKQIDSLFNTIWTNNR